MFFSALQVTQAGAIVLRLIVGFAALGIVCSPMTHAAEWQEFHSDDHARYAYDVQSRRQAPRPRITILKNFHQPTPQGDLAARLLYEADCDAARIRLLNGIYSRNKTADGGVSGMINSNGWMTAQATPLHEKLYAMMCTVSDASEAKMKAPVNEPLPTRPGTETDH